MIGRSGVQGNTMAKSVPTQYNTKCLLKQVQLVFIAEANALKRLAAGSPYAI